MESNNFGMEHWWEGGNIGGRWNPTDLEGNIGGRMEAYNFVREHWWEVESNNFGREHLGGNTDFCFATVCSILYYFVVIFVLCEKMPTPKQDKHAPGPTGRTITLPKNYGD